MSSKILITGGAGFIGSHLADELLRQGHEVRVLDALAAQVHGAQRPEYLSREVELVEGDVTDPTRVRRALEGVDAVYHLAAAVGVGQSMYEIAHYTRANNVGTAVLLEALVEHPVDRLVVASSMSIYGEGLYRDREGALVHDARRTGDQLRAHEWEPRDDGDEPLDPVPTPENKAPELASVYALSKYDQERLCLIVGEAYGIPTTALRFFNVYGPRQALGNPYTGVMAIFASRILNGKAPLVFEDGHQRRDFVSVHDVAHACALALNARASVGEVINIGSGQPRTVLEVAETMLDALGRRDLEPSVAGKYRMGDVRHCYADITKARKLLDYRPRVAFDKGIAELTEWLRDQEAPDRSEDAAKELDKRGLVV